MPRNEDRQTRRNEMHLSELEWTGERKEDRVDLDTRLILKVIE